MVGWSESQDGFTPVGDWLSTVRAFVSELKRYDTTKVEYPPARIVKLTMAADGAENEPGYTLVHSSLYTRMIDLGVYIYVSLHEEVWRHRIHHPSQTCWSR